MGKLKSCPDCKYNVSKKAKNCPNCGAPLKKSKVLSGCLILIVLSFIFFYCSLSLLDTSENGIQEKNEQVSSSTGSDKNITLFKDNITDICKDEMMNQYDRLLNVTNVYKINWAPEEYSDKEFSNYIENHTTYRVVGRTIIDGKGKTVSCNVDSVSLDIKAFNVN